MIEKILIAGAGGQGIMLFGKVLAEAAMREGKQVTWLPSYGAEVRGGTAHCMVAISDAEIASPFIDKADTLIIMNSPSFERFKKGIKNKGLLIVNSSLVTQEIGQNDYVFKHPFTDLALELGNIKVANMLALGYLIAKKKIIDLKTVFEVIESIAPADKRGLIEINKKALQKGASLQ